MTRFGSKRRRWSGRIVLTSVASLAGVAIATYLTLAHYSTSISLACPNTGAIDCAEVTSSAESVFLGVPVAVLGLAYFVAMLALSLPWAWRTALRAVPLIRIAMAVVGIVFVFHLLYAELFTIRAICLWCSGVHVLTFVLFVAVVTGWREATAGWWIDEVESAAHSEDEPGQRPNRLRRATGSRL
jgi:uncharacterized membrane protein